MEELIDDAITHFSSHAYLINHIFKSKRFLSQIISPSPLFFPYDIHFVTILLYFFLFQLLRHSSIAIKIKTSIYLKTQVAGDSKWQTVHTSSYDRPSVKEFPVSTHNTHYGLKLNPKICPRIFFSFSFA